MLQSRRQTAEGGGGRGAQSRPRSTSHVQHGPHGERRQDRVTRGGSVGERFGRGPTGNPLRGGCRRRVPGVPVFGSGPIGVLLMASSNLDENWRIRDRRYTSTNRRVRQSDRDGPARRRPFGPTRAWRGAPLGRASAISWPSSTPPGARTSVSSQAIRAGLPGSCSRRRTVTVSGPRSLRADEPTSWPPSRAWTWM
jgi:hypothetical protein